MEEGEHPPKNVTNCDTAKEGNSNVINHHNDDPVTKKEADNETKTVSMDKSSHEGSKAVSKDENNASNTTKEKRESNFSEQQKSSDKILPLKSGKNESKDSRDSKLLKENSLSAKNDIPEGHIGLLDKKESENDDDECGIDNEKSLEKDKNEISVNAEATKSSNAGIEDKDGEKVDPQSNLKNPPPLPRRQSLDKKVSAKIYSLFLIYSIKNINII